MATIFIFFIFHDIKNCLLTPTNQLANHINNIKYKKKSNNLYTFIREHKNSKNNYKNSNNIYTIIKFHKKLKKK